MQPVIEDVASAAEMLRQRAGHYRIDADRLLLVGHSIGGFAALEGAAQGEDIHCVTGIAPADFGAVARYLDTTALVGDSIVPRRLSMNAVKEKREVAIEPAKSWRNKWFVPWQQVDRKTERHFVGPGIDWDDERFSSKDLAETAAAEDLLGWRAYPAEQIPIYLGAFPELG